MRVALLYVYTIYGFLSTMAFHSQGASSACPSSTTIRLDDLRSTLLSPLVYPPIATIALL